MWSAFVSFPSAPLTQSLVLRALKQVLPTIEIVHTNSKSGQLIQWATYDDIDHGTTLANPSKVLSSSYVIRKSLIRKHFLNRTIHVYVTKNPSSILAKAFPQTWDFELAFADELDEHLQDDLYDLSMQFEAHSEQWWILKPGMADRGIGLRVFRTADELASILEELDVELSENEDEQRNKDNGGQMLSQLRHFVVQKYLSFPVLFDPIGDGRGHKFHLRAYCVAVGALKVFLYSRILALFAAHPYRDLTKTDELGSIDLAAHLTNTSQHNSNQDSDPYVKLLDELAGRTVLGIPGYCGTDEARLFSEVDIIDLVSQMKHILEDTFKAAVANPVHFMPLPNAFELYGVDFLVTFDNLDKSKYRVSLLEFNAEPAIEMTGQRLMWILELMFERIAELAVKPFVSKEMSSVGDFNELECCLSVSLNR